MQEKKYPPEEFFSISALAKIQEGSFSTLGFLFVLKDILGESGQGVIDLKALAASAGITMMRLYSFLGVLEDSFLIRTTATPEGRHIELLTGHPQEQQAKPEQECLDFLSEYLKAHNIEPGSFSGGQDISPDVLKTAVYLGDHFQNVRGFYSALKSTLNDFHEFEYSLAEANVVPEDNGRVVAFARGLHKLGYLSAFSYKKAPHRVITAQAAHSPEAHRFISGSWLELWAWSAGV